MRTSWLILGCLCGAAVMAGQILTSAQTQDTILHKGGLNVVPVYEGWYKNTDGTISGVVPPTVEIQRRLR